MDERVVRWADLRPRPWRNGGGVTRDVAEGDGWRMSIADVIADAEFSTFPNTDRIITLVEGPELTLDTGGRTVRLTTGHPVDFDGSARTIARRSSADEPSRVLNLMTDRGRRSGRVVVGPAGFIDSGPIAAMVVEEPVHLGSVALGRLDAVVGGVRSANLTGAGRLAFVIVA